jgi:hypothetical protein
MLGHASTVEIEASPVKAAPFMNLALRVPSAETFLAGFFGSYRLAPLPPLLWR